MGVDTCAIIENRLGAAELSTLAQRLTVNPELSATSRQYDIVLRSVCPTLLTDLYAKPWELKLLRAPEEIDRKLVESGWDAGHLAECWGPFGVVYVHEKLAQLCWFMCLWYTFLREPHFRASLFEATRLISSVLNVGVASTVVFVPDNGYAESAALDDLNRTMPELLALLREKYGPPVESLESIVQEDEDGVYDFKGYLVAQLPVRDPGG